MTKYLISFDDGWMAVPDEDLPDMIKELYAVREAAEAAGAWVFSAGLQHQVPKVVDTDGTVTDGPYPESKEHIGGFVVVDVASHAEALTWATRLAAACRCRQEVYELMPDAEA